MLADPLRLPEAIAGLDLHEQEADAAVGTSRVRLLATLARSLIGQLLPMGFGRAAADTPEISRLPHRTQRRASKSTPQSSINPDDSRIDVSSKHCIGLTKQGDEALSIDSRPTDIRHRLFREPRHLNVRVPEPNSQDDLNASISASIVMVEKAAEMVGSMRETVRMHEDTIYNQSNDIAQLSSQKEDALEKLLQVESIYRREAEKAAKAEAQSAAMIERIRALEQRNSNLTAQLERMIQAVSKSFATSSDPDVYSQLRSVS